MPRSRNVRSSSFARAATAFLISCSRLPCSTRRLPTYHADARGCARTVRSHSAAAQRDTGHTIRGCRTALLLPLQQQGREFIGHVEHHIMPACKLLPPPAALSCLGEKLAERTFIATRQNVSDGCDAVAGPADLRRRFKTGQRVHRALAVHPGGVCRIDREGRRGSRRNSPA